MSATHVAADGLDQRELSLAFVDSTPDWLFAKDLEHRFLFVNHSFAAAQGLEPRDMIGRRDTDFWGEEQCEPNPATGHPGFHSDDRRAFAGETVRNPHDAATVADGSIRVFDTVKSPLRARDGRIVGVLCSCRDVTDRARVAEALRESEERYRTLVGNIPGSVYRSEVRPPYRDLFLSEGILGISGYEAHEYFEPGGPSCGALILPDDLPRVQAAVQAALDAREAFHIRYRIRHRDGSIRWMSEQGRAAYAADGTPLYLEGVHIDVTAQVLAEQALREREEHLRAIVETEPECVKLLDREGRVLEMNAAGLGMLEADGLDQVRGRSVLPLVRSADRLPFERMIAAVFSGESRKLVFDIQGQRGTGRTLETHSVPMWDAEHREVRALLAVTRDITERRRAEAESRSLENQLRQSQKMEALGTLAGGIAHDFNNVLTAIFAHSELLAAALPAAGELRSEVEGILSASTRARDLVQQISTFSRRHEQERRTVALQPIVREALRFARATLPTSIEIRTEIAPEGRLVLANASQVHQVLLNLLTNAAHAMREGNGLLTVSCGEVDLDEAFCRRHAGVRCGPYLHLALTDTGHGMDPATLERVFEPFFTTKPSGEGTGLGLAVVHGIVQAHEGLITIESQLGRGTTTHLYFPATERGEPVAETPEPFHPRGRGEHVLIVDDEPALVALAGRVLAQLGYRTTGHNRPEEALRGFLACPEGFDLVLCDLTMPHMNGLEVAAQILEVRPELPVVLTTGSLDIQKEESLEGLGIAGLITKPFTIQTLAEAVQRHLWERG